MTINDDYHKQGDDDGSGTVNSRFDQHQSILIRVISLLTGWIMDKFSGWPGYQQEDFSNGKIPSDFASSNLFQKRNYCLSINSIFRTSMKI